MFNNEHYKRSSVGKETLYQGACFILKNHHHLQIKVLKTLSYLGMVLCFPFPLPRQFLATQDHAQNLDGQRSIGKREEWILYLIDVLPAVILCGKGQFFSLSQQFCD